MIEQPAPSTRFFVVWSLFTLATYVAVGSTAQMLHLAWGLWASELVLFAGLAVIGWQVAGFAPKAAFGMTRFEGRSFGLGVAYGTINYLAWAVPLMALAEAIFPQRIVEMFDSSQLFNRNSQLEVVIAIAGAAIAAPFCEELFFRGFVQQGFREAPRGIVVTALIFSAFHFDPVGFMARFELGVLFGLLAWRAGSLWPAIGAHAANNTVSTLLFFLSGDEKDAELVWWVPVLLFVVGNSALYVLARATKGTLTAREPMQRVAIDVKPPATLFAPWVLGGVASFLLLLAVDWRGVALNLIDARLQPAQRLRTSDDVKALRAKARAGDAPLSDYEARLQSSR